MIRAAAKNHSHVAVVVDPSDYDELLQHLSGDSGSSEAVQYRKRLAWKAFQHCATYDSTVAEWLWSQIGTLIEVASARFCEGSQLKAWHGCCIYLSHPSCLTFALVQSFLNHCCLPQLCIVQMNWLCTYHLCHIPLLSSCTGCYNDDSQCFSYACAHFG